MGGEPSTFQAKMKNNEEKTNKYLSQIMKENLISGKEKNVEEKNEDFKSNLTIRIYSEEKCSTKYKEYLKSIKMDKWNIKYLDNGFSKEKTKELQNEYKAKSKNRQNFDEILVIIIDSYESFIKTTRDKNKNFLNNFNDCLFPEQQPKCDSPFIVSIRDDSGDSVRHYTDIGWRSSSFLQDNAWIVDNEINYNVEAWMFMPEPYKKENE